MNFDGQIYREGNSQDSLIDFVYPRLFIFILSQKYKDCFISSGITSSLYIFATFNCKVSDANLVGDKPLFLSALHIQ